MEELLKQSDNGTNLLSMFEQSLSNIFKEIDILKYHLVDAAARRNVEESEPTQNIDMNDINQVRERLIEALEKINKQKGLLIRQSTQISEILESNTNLNSQLHEERREKLELKLNLIEMKHERIGLMVELKALTLKQKSNSK